MVFKPRDPKCQPPSLKKEHPLKALFPIAVAFESEKYTKFFWPENSAGTVGKPTVTLSITIIPPLVDTPPAVPNGVVEYETNAGI
jgi:hypothetical protein